jgi:DNA-binding NtrC family response regulator
MSTWLKKQVEQYERKLIIDMLNNNHWHQIDTAAQLGISSVTLHLKMRRYGLLRSQMKRESNPKGLGV